MKKKRSLSLYLYGEKMGFFENKLNLKALNLNKKKWKLSFRYIILIGIVCVLMIFF